MLVYRLFCFLARTDEPAWPTAPMSQEQITKARLRGAASKVASPVHVLPKPSTAAGARVPPPPPSLEEAKRRRWTPNPPPPRAVVKFQCPLPPPPVPKNVYVMPKPASSPGLTGCPIMLPVTRADIPQPKTPDLDLDQFESESPPADEVCLDFLL